MTEFLLQGWEGWLRFMDSGKLAALLLASLLFLWLGGKALRREQKGLLVYTTGMTVCCICPVTAAALMWYQTRFYDYQWVWSLVPMTAVIAWGVTVLLGEQWKGDGSLEWKRGLPVALLVLAVLLLCGSMGRNVTEDGGKMEERKRAAEVLSQISGQFTEEQICLWAPREIMEYAREIDASVRLVYGRNLWDESLNAYVYDVYPPEARGLAIWMERAAWNVMEMDADEAEGKKITEDDRKADEAEGKETVTDDQEMENAGKESEKGRMTGEECVRWALSEGVNCILLPGNLSREIVEKLSEIFDGSVIQLEEYYLLTR